MTKIQDRLDGMAAGNDSMSNGSLAAVIAGSFDAGGSFASVTDGSLAKSGDSVGRSEDDLEEIEMF